jgi:undecaprenyl-diphosphatase
MARLSRPLAWAVPRGWWITGPLLVALAVVLGFTVKALPGVRLIEDRLDPWIAAVRSPVADVVAVALDRLDTIPVVAGVMVVVLVIVGLALSWRDAVAVVIVTAAAWASSLIVKIVVAQPRPALDLRRGLPVESTTLSYPSGHLAFVVVVAVVLASAAWRTRARMPILVVGAIAAIVVGWSRLYVGVHHPTDLVGSVLLGVGAALLLCGILATLTRRVAR